ncbi:hypothetical protein ACOI1C_19755 [Bacillus sp. DJP31]|uniref:hypothetical protein n=1 Tax=Bacillus sp. DJP31 TaxID=3409789 RepID=UPI003BB64306
MYIGTQMALLKKAQQREQFLNEMKGILNTAKKEDRSFSDEENTKFEKLQKSVESIDAELEKNDTNLIQDLRKIKMK